MVCEGPNCSKEIDVIDQINKRAATIYNINGDKKRIVPWTGLAFVLFGIVFSVYNYFIAYASDFLITTLSIMMLVIGFLLIRRALKWGMDL